jgi:Flp pilus assembly protein TadD
MVLDNLGRPDAAILELRESANLDNNYAEPHFALARIYHRMGLEAEADQEVKIYRRIHSTHTSSD